MLSRKRNKIVQIYRTKHKINFSRHEFNDLSKQGLIDLGEERRLRNELRHKEKLAAVIIQSAFRSYTARKSYKQYEQQYKESQKRILAAMKIQIFYRSNKNAKVMIQRMEEKKVIEVEKNKMINMFTDYIIRFKYLKPRLHSLLKQLDRIIQGKRQVLVVSAVILIQYNVRKLLKKLRAKREAAKPKKKPIVKKKAWIQPEWRAPGKYNLKNEDKKSKENLKLNKKSGKKSKSKASKNH